MSSGSTRRSGFVADKAMNAPLGEIDCGTSVASQFARTSPESTLITLILTEVVWTVDFNASLAPNAQAKTSLLEAPAMNSGIREPASFGALNCFIGLRC